MEYEKLIQLSEITQELLSIKETIKELRFKVSELEVHIDFIDYESPSFAKEVTKLLVNSEFLNLRTQIKIKKIDTIRYLLIGLTIDLVGAPKQTTLKLENGFEIVEECFIEVYELKKHIDVFKEQLKADKRETLEEMLNKYQSVSGKIDHINDVIKRDNEFIKNIANEFLLKVKNTEGENNSDNTELVRNITLKVLLSKLDCLLDEFTNIKEQLNIIEKVIFDDNVKESLLTTKKVVEIKINYCNKLIWSFKRINIALNSRISDIEVEVMQKFIDENNEFASI